MRFTHEMNQEATRAGWLIHLPDNSIRLMHPYKYYYNMLSRDDMREHWKRYMSEELEKGNPLITELFGYWVAQEMLGKPMVVKYLSDR